MVLDGLSEQDRKEVEDTRSKLNALFHQVLNEFSRSAKELNFPEQVKFDNGSWLDGIAAKAAANIVPQLVREGKLLIAVEPGFTGPLFSVSQCSFTRDSKVDEAKFIGALFVGNFFSRCLADGAEPQEMVKKAISRIVYHDALMTAQTAKRAAVPLNGKTDLIRIYSGPRLA